jgi:hypothetical protein
MTESGYYIHDREKRDAYNNVVLRLRSAIEDGAGIIDSALIDELESIKHRVEEERDKINVTFKSTEDGTIYRYDLDLGD